MRHEVQIDGHNFYNLDDFLGSIHELFHFPSYVAKDLDGLLDGLTTHIDPNLTIYWLNHDTSVNRLGNDFERVIEVFNRAKSYHEGFKFYLN